ncbi:MAG: hypothetical protein JEZ11_06880 [Desulfobacterales bacterium]|nr:hypothetical protein [Desulfobacterales bacterium]
MSETKRDFLKRKKSEKRLQAEKQVRQAFENTQDAYVENIHGMKDRLNGTLIDGEFVEWRIQMEPEIEELYSTIDICNALELPRERLRDWMVRGFVKPSLPSTSKGTIAIFIRPDVMTVALFKVLIDRGFRREAAAEYANLLRDVSPQDIDRNKLLILTSTVINGKFETETHLTIGKGSFDLKIDSDGKIEIPPSKKGSNQDWNDIHIINLRNLYKDVDLALSNL